MVTGVRVYWGDDYFYAVAVDGEYEYMPYAEYLLIRDRVPGYGVLFMNPPSIADGKVGCFDFKVVGVKRVERINDEVFFVSSDKGGFLTDGGVSVRVTEELVKALDKAIGRDYRIVTNYNFTNASFILYSRGKFVVVYRDLFLKYDVKKGEFTNSEERRTYIVVIDLDSKPTTGTVYEVVGDDVRFLGKSYVEDIPIYDYGAGGCLGDVLHDGFDTFVRVGPDGVKIIKKTRHGQLNVLLKKYLRRDDIRELPSKFEKEYKIMLRGNTVYGIVEYEGEVYYIESDVKFYVLAGAKEIIKHFGKKLPLVKDKDGKMYLDFRGEGKGERKRKVYTIFGREFEDYGYCLVWSDGERRIAAPLVEVVDGKKKYALPFEAYEFFMGGDFEPDLGDFVVYKYSIIHVPLLKGMHRYPAFKDTFLFRGYVLPNEEPLKKFVERFGDFVDNIEYVPSRENFGIVFWFGDLRVHFFKEMLETFVTFDDVSFAFVLDDDLAVKEFYERGELEDRRLYYQGDHFLIEVGESGVESVKFMRKERVGKRRRRIINFPLTAPKYVYAEDGVWLAVDERLVVRFAEVPLPRSCVVEKIVKSDEVWSLLVVCGDDEVEIEVFDDGSAVVLGDNGMILFEASSVDELYIFMSVAEEMGGVKKALDFL